MKKKLFFLNVLFYSVNLFGFDIVLLNNLNSGFKNNVFIAASLDEDEVVYKDTIQVSIDNPSIKIENWEILTEIDEEDVLLSKLRKKGYKNSFTIRVELAENKENQKGSIYFACLSSKEDENVTPILKSVSLPFKKETVSKTTFLQESNRPLIKQKLDKKVIYSLFANSHLVLKSNKNLLFFNTKFLLILLLLVLFLGFIFIEVLSIKDMLLLAVIIVWVYFSNFIIQFYLSLEITALLLLFASVWYLRLNKNNSLFLQRTRIILGIFCASLILPVLIQACLFHYFYS